MYAAGDALIVQAVASPYRERSHFDGQDVLENGVEQAGERRDGWLNRALAPLAADRDPAIALAQNPPLVLRGDQPVASWAPSTMPDTDDDTLARIERMYANDAFFADRLAMALDARDIAADAGTGNGGRRGNRRGRDQSLVQAAARFLKAPDGPRIAVLESGGWDTHANQGNTTGSLANKFADLDAHLGVLRDELDDAWASTVVAVVTEFGRTAAVNGTRGTDHGTASAALLVGGAVNGGRVIADWPGLGSRDLYDGRDLYPTTDLRAVFKGVLIDHLHLAPAYVESEVFPGSTTATALKTIVA